jgi:dynein light intermediate chain 1
MTLYSPPQQSGTGVQVLGAEAEEAARLEVHTLPDAAVQYAATLRALLKQKSASAEEEDTAQGETADGQGEVVDQFKPGVCILLSWKEPWKFLQQLKQWVQLLAQACLQPGLPATDPLDVLKEAELRITLVVQHTESQESLFREGYKEEDFDYISQCLRTAILPLHPLSAMIYTSSNSPPQQPGSALSEQQKVVFNSLGLDLAALSPRRPRSSSGEGSKKEELIPKHEFMDRMAIVIPAGWDSPAFIRTLSETFSPEVVVNGWLEDIQPPPPPKLAPGQQDEQIKRNERQANGGAEVFESVPPEDPDEFPSPPMSPSKMPPSAVRTYESRVHDPQAYKAVRTAQIEVVTKPDQIFLTEMREHLQHLEAQDRERESKGQHTAVSNTSLSGIMGRASSAPSGEPTGAMKELGEVSFNVGGVNYDTITAEAAINALKRPQHMDSSSPMSASSRVHTPKPPRPGYRDTASTSDERRGSVHTPGTGAKESTKSPESKEPLQIDKLEEYFQSLLTKSGGANNSTPTRRGGPSD